MKEKSNLEIISDETKEMDDEIRDKAKLDDEKDTKKDDRNVEKAFDEARKAGEKIVFNNKKAGKGWLGFLIPGIIGLIGGIACLLFVFLKPPEERSVLVFPEIPSKTAKEEIYSDLTGEVLASAGLKNASAYCIQVPNGQDGARPQAGLTQAGVIFEAIAEAGITRFAAIFQNPSSAVIGPIRSLRIYYLNWDTPFDCTVVHAGGADDAIAALRSGGYRELDESYYYMYRGTVGSRLWNNLFTTSADLARFSEDSGYTTSNINGFSRLTPAEANKAKIDGLVEEKLDILKGTEKSTSNLIPKVSDIYLTYGDYGSYNPHYHYDVGSNTFLRGYANGDAHEVYQCPDEDLGEVNPESACSLTQLAPKVVAVMMVEERKAEDNYHEDIDSLGSGEAFVFQNGMVTHGTWNKGSAGEQIKFLDEAGNEIRLIPGQTFVSAVPTYGGVDY